MEIIKVQGWDDKRLQIELGMRRARVEFSTGFTAVIYTGRIRHHPFKVYSNLPNKRAKILESG